MNALPAEPIASGFRALPENREAERALLGALLMRNQVLDRVSDLLKPAHFADPLHGKVYAAIVQLAEADRQANPVTLKGHFENDIDVQRAGGIKYLTGLASAVTNIVNVSDYARIVQDLYMRRAMIQFAQSLADQAYEVDLDGSGAALVERAEVELTALNASGSSAADISLSDAAWKAIDEWESADKDDGVGVPTGIPTLEGLIGKARGGGLLVIAGNAGMGKTALVTTIALNAVRQGKRGAFFSLEMSAEQLAGRVLTAHTAIPGPRQRRWKLDEGQMAKLITARGDFEGLPLTLRYVPGLTMPALRSASRRFKRKWLDFIVVDYLQIMGRTPGVRYDNRVQEISDLTRGMKTLAGELEVPIFLLSQLSRENWKRDNPRPMLSDLRDSGTIEQDADQVLFAYRHEYFLEHRVPEQKDFETDSKFSERRSQWEANLEACRGFAEIIVAKNRHGPTGVAKCKFDAKRAWFEADVSSSQRSDDQLGMQV